MPRLHVTRSLLAAAAGRAALAGSAAAESKALFSAVGKAGRPFSSIAGSSLFTRGTTTRTLGNTRCSCGKVFCNGHSSISTSVKSNAADAALVEEVVQAPSLTARHEEVAKHFPTAMGVDDFMARVEMALAAYGFTGDNAIAMSNLCRDESCMILEDMIESVFGSCFSTHGLGGVLTCGVIGIGAGLSHSPVENGKERYVFFSFPHIAIDSDGRIGAIARPNRPGASAACGALIKTMLDLKEGGVDAHCSIPGLHDPLDPEYSIIKSRIARRIKYEKGDISRMSLVDITKVAERVISTDLEYLISKAVNPQYADYAVVTGVQIHNWASDLADVTIPSMEFVAPARTYVVVNGEKLDIDLHQVPALSPRQLQQLAAHSVHRIETSKHLTTGTPNSMLQAIPRDYLLNRLGGVNTSIHLDVEHQGPSWREYIETTYHNAHRNAPKMDEHFFREKIVHLVH